MIGKVTDSILADGQRGTTGKRLTSWNVLQQDSGLPLLPLRRTATNLAALKQRKKTFAEALFSSADGGRTASSIPPHCRFGQRQSRLGRKIRTILLSRILETLLIIHARRGLKTSAAADAHKHARHQSPFLSTPFIEVFIKCHRLFTEPYRVKNMNYAEGQILNNSPTAIGKCWFPMTHFLFLFFLF